MTNNKKLMTLRKRFVTLIEMMIVMFLIALITGVVAYNYSGTLDKGKAFKTTANMTRIQSILSLSLAEDPSLDISGTNWHEVIRHSPLVQNPDSLIHDGWGGDYQVSIDPSTNVITVTSPRYEAYMRTQKSSATR